MGGSRQVHCEQEKSWGRVAQRTKCSATGLSNTLRSHSLPTMFLFTNFHESTGSPCKTIVRPQRNGIRHVASTCSYTINKALHLQSKSGFLPVPNKFTPGRCTDGRQPSPLRARTSGGHPSEPPSPQLAAHATHQSPVERSHYALSGPAAEAVLPARPDMSAAARKPGRGRKSAHPGTFPSIYRRPQNSQLRQSGRRGRRPLPGGEPSALQRRRGDPVPTAMVQV